MSEEDRDYLWRGLVLGFDIVDPDCPASYHCENYDSITSDVFYEEMTRLLLDELAQGKVSISEDRPTCVHSLGAVTKSNGKLRPITDCSRPDGVAINNYMTTTFQSFSYNSIEDAVQLLNNGDFMAVVDVSSAYRSVNVSADHVQFQGLSWDFGDGPVWLRDRRLCFGLRCAPNIYNAISNFIVRVANSWGAARVINYLDDFLIIADTYEACLIQRNIVASVIEFLGASVAWKKVTEPATTTTFLGISIDSINMELTLPLEKVHKLRASITSSLDKGYASKKDLERIGGLVSYCSYVVRGGRTFSRRIFDLAASYTRKCSRIPLDDAIKADFDWWLAFCGVFNGKACIIRELHPIPMYSDSSFRGFGAWLGKDWFLGSWEPQPPCIQSTSMCEHELAPPSFNVPTKNINVYELWPVLAGVKRWAPHFTNRRLHVITDNMQVLAMINTGRSINKLCMSWLREIFWMCFIYNMDLHATYIKSADNILADALSRAGYHGVRTKCAKYLCESNMCCASSFRSNLETDQEETTRPSRSSTVISDQEVETVSSDLLHAFLRGL